MRYCPHCESYNGTVKKVTGQALRVVHDKYNLKTPDDVMQDFVKEFDHACAFNNENNGQVSNQHARGAMEQNIKKTLIDLDALTVYNLFKNIKEEDVVYFNMDAAICKPVDMMITCIPAPPSCIRPTVAMSHGLKNEDDLTITLAEIIERNKQIRQSIMEGLEPQKLMEDWYHLQCTVAIYLNSDAPGMPIQM